VVEGRGHGLAQRFSAGFATVSAWVRILIMAGYQCGSFLKKIVFYQC